MLKLSIRIGCNYSPSFLVNQQTESMTEKFFERALFPRLFQLNCGKSRAWSLGTACPARRESIPKYNTKNPPPFGHLLQVKEDNFRFPPQKHRHKLIKSICQNSLDKDFHFFIYNIVYQKKDGQNMTRIVFHIDVNSAFLSWSAKQVLEKGYKTDMRDIVSVV